MNRKLFSDRRSKFQRLAPACESPGRIVVLGKDVVPRIFADLHPNGQLAVVLNVEYAPTPPRMIQLERSLAENLKSALPAKVQEAKST